MPKMRATEKLRKSHKKRFFKADEGHEKAPKK